MSMATVLMLSNAAAISGRRSLLRHGGGGSIEQPVEAPQEETSSPYKAPLTGLPLEASLTQRPLAVMINNAPAARPQSGLGQADMVYEVLAEGRDHATDRHFQSQSGIEKIGRFAHSSLSHQSWRELRRRSGPRGRR